MSQLLSGSICYTDLLEQLKKGHSSGIKAGNGKLYVNVSIWIKDAPDKFDNDASMQLNPKKDSGDDRPYIGNFRFIDLPEAAPINETDLSGGDEDDLPF